MKGQIEKYKIVGKIYSWKYKENDQNYPGWNITFDRDANESIIDLLNLMDKCEWSSKKTISVESPNESQLKVVNNRKGKATWNSRRKLTLNCKKNEPEDYWLIKELDNCIEIHFGIEKLTEFKNAVNSISNGKGDFAISDKNDENILYFWWNLDT